MTVLERTIQKHGAPLLGVSTHFYDPVFVEIARYSGFHVLWIETEHAPISFSQAADLCRIAGSNGLMTMIRISDTRRENVLKAAECGPDIIDVPMANSIETLQELVQHARFPPEGNRGFFAISRAVRYGMLDDIKSEQQRINSHLSLMIQIETEQAVGCVDELCRFPGVDAVFIGLGDLSASLGVTGQTNHSSVLEAADTVIAAARNHGKRIAIMGQASEAAEWARKGVDLLFCGSDVACLKMGARSLMEQVRESHSRNGKNALRV